MGRGESAAASGSATEGRRAGAICGALPATDLRVASAAAGRAADHGKEQVCHRPRAWPRRRPAPRGSSRRRAGSARPWRARCVGEDDIGGHRLFAGDARALAAQRLEDRRRLLVHPLRHMPGALEPRRLAPPVAAQHHAALAAKHRPRVFVRTSAPKAAWSTVRSPCATSCRAIDCQVRGSTPLPPRRREWRRDPPASPFRSPCRSAPR